jgi:hypothetical protein
MLILEDRSTAFSRISTSEDPHGNLGGRSTTPCGAAFVNTPSMIGSDERDVSYQMNN